MAPGGLQILAPLTTTMQAPIGNWSHRLESVAVFRHLDDCRLPA